MKSAGTSKGTFRSFRMISTIGKPTVRISYFKTCFFLSCFRIIVNGKYVMFCVVLCCIATILAHFVSFVNALLNKNVPFAENILFTQKYSPHFYKTIFQISSATYGTNDVWHAKSGQQR